MSTPLADRRQRAREEFYDMFHDTASDDGPVFEMTDCLRAAVETATRVRIDGDVLSAACFASGLHENLFGGPMRHALRAAFIAAGFEIEE